MKRLILSAEEIYRRERDAVEVFGIPLLILMENAGKAAAGVIRRILRKKGHAVIVCGRGNNGGDGLVAGRYLLNAGYRVSFLIAGEGGELSSLAFTNYQILCKMKADMKKPQEQQEFDILKEADIVVDAVFGIGLRGPVREPEKKFIEQINSAGRTVVSLDIPSGLDANSGEVLGQAVQADITVCFGFLKQGLFKGEGPVYAGQIKLVDIGFPPPLYSLEWNAEVYKNNQER